MKSKVKFFFLGYFSNQTAKQAKKRGLGIMFWSIILSALLLLVGLIGASTLPTGFVYRNADHLRATVERTFADVKVSVVDGKIIAGKDEQGNQLIVDTVRNAEDKQKYSVDDFDVVVDTRLVDAYDDFTAVCKTASGKEISYEEYLALDDEVKSLYTFQVQYSGKERVIDEGWTARCEAYLDRATDATIAKEYDDVKKLTGSDYKKALYELYVKAYYPDLSKYETGGVAPRLRNSYTHNYKEKTNILFVFNDSLIARFTTDKGEQQIFYGFYVDMPNGEMHTNFNSVHDFLTQSFKSANAVIVYSSIINFMSIMPYLVFISFIVMIIAYCLCMTIDKKQTTFGGIAKITCNFLLWTVIFTDLIMLALSLWIAQSKVFGFACVVFFVTLLLRAAVFVLVEWRNHKLEEAKKAEDEQSSQANQTEAEI